MQNEKAFGLLPFHLVRTLLPVRCPLDDGGVEYYLLCSEGCGMGSVFQDHHQSFALLRRGGSIRRTENLSIIDVGCCLFVTIIGITYEELFCESAKRQTVCGAQQNETAPGISCTV